MKRKIIGLCAWVQVVILWMKEHAYSPGTLRSLDDSILHVLNPRITRREK